MQQLALCLAGYQAAVWYGQPAHPHGLRRCLHTGIVMCNSDSVMAGHMAGARKETTMCRCCSQQVLWGSSCDVAGASLGGETQARRLTRCCRSCICRPGPAMQTRATWPPHPACQAMEAPVRAAAPAHAEGSGYLMQPANSDSLQALPHHVEFSPGACSQLKQERSAAGVLTGARWQSSMPNSATMAPKVLGSCW